MADVVDAAQNAGIFLELEANIKNRKQYNGVSPELCDECGETIEPKRREILPGVRHCSECAAWLESNPKYRR